MSDEAPEFPVAVLPLAPLRSKTELAGSGDFSPLWADQSGHPSGKIVDREQAYVLLQVFIPYCKEMHQLMLHFA